MIGAFVLGPFGWRVLTFVTAIPPTIALGMSLYLDESPTWLAEKGKHERAKTVLSKICRENCGRDLPLGVRIVPSSEVEEGGNTGVHTSVSSDGGDVLVDSNDQTGGGMKDGKFRDSTEKTKKTVLEKTLFSRQTQTSGGVWWNLLGTKTNLARTLCLWILAFVQTFNFYGLMLHSPTVFRKTVYFEQALDAGGTSGLTKVRPCAHLSQIPPPRFISQLVTVVHTSRYTRLTLCFAYRKVDVVSSIRFDYPAILVVNAGDVVGNLTALYMLRRNVNPRHVAFGCALLSIPPLFAPLFPALKTSRWGLVLTMLLGRIPAAPIGAMSWILNAVAYPTLFRATGHGYANAVARFGAVAASSMYSAKNAVSIPIHAVALLLAAPAALFAPKGSLETQGGASLKKLFRGTRK